jgi:hypothetical protein
MIPPSVRGRSLPPAAGALDSLPRLGQHDAGMLAPVDPQGRALDGRG